MKDRTPEQLRGNELCLHDLGKVHKNVLQVETYCSDGEKGSWIFSPLCKYGNLINYRRTHAYSFKNQAVKLDIMKQTAAGLEFLHSLNKVHRDIKPGNILLTKGRDQSLLVQITDFGESRDITERSMKTAVGTRPFAAPEIYMNMDTTSPGTVFRYNSKVDIFSLGLTFLAIIQEKSNLLPEGKGTKIEIGNKMLDDNDYKPVEMEENGDDFTKHIKSLILKMVVFDARERLSASDVRRELEAVPIHGQVKLLKSTCIMYYTFLQKKHNPE